jgi:hypothetical protein
MSHAVLAPTLIDHGSVGAGTSTPDVSKGLYHRITCTAATRTIGAPNYPSFDTSRVGFAGSPIGQFIAVGTVMFIEVRNASGGVLTLTWDSAYKQAIAAPANGQRRVYGFIFDGLNWVEMYETSDVPN